jgi:hypothetical protein
VECLVFALQGLRNILVGKDNETKSKIEQKRLQQEAFG